MTRSILCWMLAAGSLALGLATALYQAENRDRGARLNDRMEKSRLLEGVTRETEAQLLGKDFGPLPDDPTLLQRAREPRPRQVDGGRRVQP